jgi:hypothetical protein
LNKGNKRLDMTSGMGQQAAFAARLLNSAWKARGGDQIWETRELGTREIVGGFGSYKLNPWLQAGFDFTSSKDVVHRPTSVGNILLSGMTPLSVQTLIEALEDSESEAEALGWTTASFMGRNVNIYDKSAPKSEETFLATVQSLMRQMTGEKPPGLKPDDLTKWLKYKVKRDTDLSKSSKYLNPSQLKQAEDRKREQRSNAIYAGAANSPGRTHADNAETFKDKIEKHKEARATLREMKGTMSYDEAIKLLRKSFKKPAEPFRPARDGMPAVKASRKQDHWMRNNKGKTTGKFKKKYKDRRNWLRKMYGISN